MNDPTPPNSDIEEGYETPDDQPTHSSLVTALEEHKNAASTRRRGNKNAPIPGGGRRKKRRRRKKGGFSTQDVIINNRNKENNLCNRFSTPVNLLNEESFKQPKLKKTIMLSKILKEGKCTSLLNKFSKKANKAMMNSTKAGRRTRRKRRRKRRRKTKRKKRRRKKRKTRRSKTRRSRRKKQHGGSVELENWRPTASYGFNGAGEFSKKIPTDSYPNFTTNPASY